MPIVIPPFSTTSGSSPVIGSDTGRYYVLGSGLEVPGIEATFEYGDASTMQHGSIPGAMRINDLSQLTRVRVNEIDGLHDDPEGRDSRAPTAGRHGERAGAMVYAGRTIGLTGRVEAGNIRAMRDQWRLFRSTFGASEKDFIIHVPDEVVGWTNELANPSLSLDAYSWVGTADGTVSGLSGGVTVGSGKTGQAVVSLTSAGSSEFFGDQTTPWRGEDVYVSARVRVSSLSSGSISAIRVGLSGKFKDADCYPSQTFGTQSSPTTGSWYTISARIPAADFDLPPETVGILIGFDSPASAGYTVQWTNAMMCLLWPDEPPPVAYFDGDTAGFEWHGAPHLSKSSGPHYAVNLIPDPTFEATEVTAQLVYWEPGVSTGVTAVSPPERSLAYGGEVGASLYAHFAKDSNTTSRDFTIYANDPDGPIKVVEGAHYQWTVTVKTLFRPVTGLIRAAIVWLDSSGTVISTSLSAPMEETEETLSFGATAPSNAVAARPSVSLLGTTTSGAFWVTHVTDPCFTDISVYDPGAFFGVGDYTLESSAVVEPTIKELARHRIPRPFVARKVRKVSDSKAPERQTSIRAVRDFTMSLRASDPRIYVHGDRRSTLKMTNTSDFVSVQAPSGFLLESTTVPAPTGFTYEGHYVTHPGVGTPYHWSQRASRTTSPLYTNPNEGVSFTAYAYVGSGTDAWAGNTPAQNIRTRMYRSGEGYTYNEPRVIIGGSPGSNYGSRSSNQSAPSIGDIGLGGGITKDNADLFTTTLTMLIKRVSSSTWLELRWRGVPHAWLSANGYGANPQNGYVFELWCSHNTAGSSGSTRLASWDYTSIDPAAGAYPFNRITDPMWLVAWVLDDVIHWELWRNYPSLISNVGRIEANSYNIPNPLKTVIGSSVPGSPGWSMDIPKTTSAINFAVMTYTPPYLHYYEQSDASLPPKSISVPVIGDIDTPEEIQIRGDVVDPIISISVPAHDDKPARTTVAHFSGTVEESNPITIDLKDGTVKDATGANRYGMLLTGAEFTTLRPGNNVVSLQAKSWGSYPSHLLISWRDALV